MSVGKKIKFFRKLRMITQDELARKIGLGGSRIRNYETDFRTPKEDKISQIADALEISPFALSTNDIQNPLSAMHILFELDQLAGIKIEKSDNSYKLTVSGNNIYSQELISYLSQWYLLQSQELDQQAYSLEKGRFPLDQDFKEINSFIKLCDHSLSTHQKDLPETLSWSDFIRMISLLMQSSLSMIIKPITTNKPFGLSIAFSLSTLESADQSIQDSFQKFYAFMERLNEYDIPILKKPLWMEEKCYLVYYMQDPLLDQIYSALIQINEELSSSSSLESSDTFINACNKFNQPISDLAKKYNAKKMYEHPLADWTIF